MIKDDFSMLGETLDTNYIEHIGTELFKKETKTTHFKIRQLKIQPHLTKSTMQNAIIDRVKVHHR